MIYQPNNCDTAAGVFLPVIYVAAQSPDATVVVFPSDHFAYPEDRLVQVARQAARAVEAMPGRLVLVGAPPDRLELEYGWIEREGSVTNVNGIQAYAVRSFLEKPDTK